MIIDTDSEREVLYDQFRMQMRFMDKVWNEIPEERFIPKNFDKIARCGRYTFYADPDPNHHDDRRYCVVDRGVDYGSQ